MAEERDDEFQKNQDIRNEQPAGQQSQQNEFGQQPADGGSRSGSQQTTDEKAEEGSSGGRAGQPIGGNDSNTGS